jgi:hypothetical protein
MLKIAIRALKCLLGLVLFSLLDLKLLAGDRESSKQNPVIQSDLTTWKNKAYLGGYKNKKLNKEFFHAFAQTTTAQEIKFIVPFFLT